ncbi:hypothetical protein SAMD00019534_014880, partial [Acytostelium subglobosum LB1]|uniref:hypothetical protein n=1 Tax=Acytostelium subglobosum LB1 TaxID=1410327 RepID=UPI000644B838
IISGTLPNNITSLTFSREYNHPIEPGVLPSSLKILTFGSEFNQPLAKGTIPRNLVKLTFGYMFNQDISPGLLHGTLKTLIFGHLYGNLKHTTIVHGSLPFGLSSLTFGGRFNQVFTKVLLPLSLKSLVLGSDYNTPMKSGALPLSLVELTLGRNFQRALHEVSFPSSLKTLYIKDYTHCRYLACQPHSIEHVSFSFMRCISFVDALDVTPVVSTLQMLIITANVFDINTMDKLLTLLPIVLDRFPGERVNTFNLLQLDQSNQSVLMWLKIRVLVDRSTHKRDKLLCIIGYGDHKNIFVDILPSGSQPFHSKLWNIIKNSVG